MKNMFRLVLQQYINGNKELVASDVHYPNYDKAERDRNRLLESKEVLESKSEVKVLVMTANTLRKLVEKEKATTMARIKANTCMSARMASGVLTAGDLERYKKMQQQLRGI